MTEGEFREWLRHIDRNKDSRISMKELAAGLKEAGFGFKWWRAWRAMKNVDKDRSGYIDTDSEIRALMEHAMKHWGFVISKAKELQDVDVLISDVGGKM
ncbi:uncharacterized protein LOC109706450 [Ananas comosus]|uniref:Uncharacterized protein LOC109706450 n=1 Tax=Ananas comosus TaxID=4615 RepID=A0A6P5END4_ANACO|nr:uncharacterized protein LOC109706450 [Ananas comosus]